MNERINELALQAEQYADDTFNADPAKYDTPEQEKVWCELMQAKFAELIVKECMMLVDGFESTQEVALDEYVDYEASAVLKEHFGVGE